MNVEGLVLLTRRDCSATKTMCAHLDGALRSLSLPADYPNCRHGSARSHVVLGLINRD